MSEVGFENMPTCMDQENAQPMANDLPFVTNTITSHVSTQVGTRASTAVCLDQRSPIKLSQERDYMVLLKVRN